MKPSDFNRHLGFIVLLLLPATGTESLARKGRNFDENLDSGALSSQSETPYWEFILREFLFKTISPPPPANYDLYKRLLEAPFYRGPFPAPTVNDDELAAARGLLSRGYVYHLADGGWIICQEGCTDCDVCKDHEMVTVPTVKWTLRRIKRAVSFARPRYDLQFTVSPQADGTFHTKNLYPVSYVYVTSNTRVLKSFTDILTNREKEQYPLATTVSVPKISENIFTTSQTEATTEGETKLKVSNDGSTDRTILTTSTSVPTTETKQVFSSRKRGRDVNQKEKENHQDRIDRDGQVKRVVEPSKPTEKSIPLILFYPSTAPAAATTDAGCRMPKNPRLILGTDQFGEKQLVHVVPAGDLDTDSTTNPSSDSVVRPISRKLLLPQVSDVAREYEDRSLYRKIFNRVVESLNDHKSAIEKFLLSPSSRSGRPSVAPTTFDNGANAGLTTSNYSERTSASDIDLEDAKVDAVAPSGVGAAVQPRDTPSSNYSAPQVHRVESQRSEPRPTTARRLQLQREPQLLDPSAADRFENKTKVRETSVVAPDDQRSTFRSSTDISTANATLTSVVPNGISNERSESRDFQERLVIPGESNLDENRTTRPEDIRNSSDTLILKEVARSVIDHADTLRDFVAASNSGSNSYRATGKRDDVRTVVHTRTEEKLVGNVPS